MKYYRWDVFFLTLSNYYLFYALTFDPNDGSFFSAFYGLFLALIPMNFVYSYNNYWDWDIDEINKPYRHKGQGKNRSNCFNHSMFLLALSVLGLVLCLFLHEIERAIFLFLLILLGILYSRPFIRLKRIPLAGTLTTAIIHQLSFYSGLGRKINVLSFNHEVRWFLIILTIYSFFLIPLKDIGDEEGDLTFQCGNWSYQYGWKFIVKLFQFVLVILLLLVILASLPLYLKLIIQLFLLVNYLIVSLKEKESYLLILKANSILGFIASGVIYVISH